MNEKKREQENVLRLVKKSRKGILRVVFSRFGLMALLPSPPVEARAM